MVCSLRPVVWEVAMRILLLPYAIRHTLYAILAFAALYLLAGATPSEGGTRIAVLPFLNVSGDLQGPAFVVPLVGPALRDRGYEVVEPEALEGFLARRRVRAPSRLGPEQLLLLGREFGADFALLGSVDLFADVAGNPQVGVSCRLLEMATGRLAWANAAGFTGDDFTGFMGLGTVTAAEVLAARTVTALFQAFPREGLQPEAAGPPPRSRSLARRVFRSPRLASGPPPRLAVLPFENATERRGAGLVVDDLMLVGLVRAGRFTVADAGVVQQSLLALGVAPYGAIDLETLRAIGQTAGVEAVILGRVTDYNEGLRPGTSSSPSIAIEVRMLDTQSGEILWMGAHEARGEDSQIVLEFGKIKSMVPLGMKVISELVGTL